MTETKCDACCVSEATKVANLKCGVKWHFCDDCAKEVKLQCDVIVKEGISSSEVKDE